MAKYKNWYLARGSGMKDERKKLKLIILQCIAVITANYNLVFRRTFFQGILVCYFCIIYFNFYIYHTEFLLFEKDSCILVCGNTSFFIWNISGIFV